MNQEQSTNYEDRIEFTIALMTGDYEKARDCGNRLLGRNRNDVDVIRALNILEQKNQHEIEECERSSSTDSPIESDNKCGGSDASNGVDVDFVSDNADSRIDLMRTTSKNASQDMSQLNIDKAKTNLEFRQKMHRVIPIKVNKKTA